METRTITQVKLYKLMLNRMTERCEHSEIVAVSDSREKLIDWYNSQLAPEFWRDGHWGKSFKKGSALEWYNPTNIMCVSYFGQGILEEWVDKSALERIMAHYDFIR